MWALILFFHVGAMGDGNSNATTSLSGFGSEQLCRAAGKRAIGMTSMTTKKGEYVCVKLQEK